MSLYEEVGGEEAIEATVDEFYDRVLSDESLERFFADADQDALRRHQIHFLTAATGGPDRYEGADMRTAHEHLDIGDEAFDQVAQHLADALEACDVDPDHRETIVGKFESFRDDVVTVR